MLKQHFVPNFNDDTSLSPEMVDAEKITQGCSMLTDHMNTVFYNLYNHISGEPTRFELRATNNNISSDQVVHFRHFMKEKGMAFLQEADNKLSEFDIENKESEDKNERIGVGVYLIYDKD